MKSIFVTIILFLPLLSWANGNPFEVRQRRVRSVDTQGIDPDNLRVLLEEDEQGGEDSSADPGVDTNPVEDPADNIETGNQQDLSNTGSFQATPGGALEGSKNVQSGGKAKKILGVAMGAGFAATCPTLGGSWACPLAAMSFADALAAGGAQSNGFRTAGAITPTGNFPSFSPANFSNTDDPFIQQALDELQELEAAGFTLNQDGSVTTPQGFTVSAQDYASKENLEKAGFPGGKAKDILASIEKTKVQAARDAGLKTEDLERLEAEGQEASVQSAAGLASSSSEAFSGGGSNSEDIIVDEFQGPFGRKKKKKRGVAAAEVSKLKKDLNGTPIGINFADLFMTVHQCYTAEICPLEKEKFIEREF